MQCIFLEYASTVSWCWQRKLLKWISWGEIRLDTYQAPHQAFHALVQLFSSCLERDIEWTISNRVNCWLARFLDWYNDAVSQDRAIQQHDQMTI